jgi:hypothetical protein
VAHPGGVGQRDRAEAQLLRRDHDPRARQRAHADARQHHARPARAWAGC